MFIIPPSSVNVAEYDDGEAYAEEDEPCVKLEVRPLFWQTFMPFEDRIDTFGSPTAGFESGMLKYTVSDEFDI